MRATGPTSASKSTVKIGAKKDGTIVAAQGTFYLQAGALPGSPIRGAVGCSFAPYDIPHVLSVGFDVLWNRSKVAAFRAPGAPIGSFALESSHWSATRSTVWPPSPRPRAGPPSSSPRWPRGRTRPGGYRRTGIRRR